MTDMSRAKSYIGQILANRVKKKDHKLLLAFSGKVLSAPLPAKTNQDRTKINVTPSYPDPKRLTRPGRISGRRM